MLCRVCVPPVSCVCVCLTRLLCPRMDDTFWKDSLPSSALAAGADGGSDGEIMDSSDSDDDSDLSRGKHSVGIVVLSVCMPTENNVAPVAVALDPAGDVLASIALPSDRRLVCDQLAEFMVSYPPDVAVVNVVSGRRNNYLAGIVNEAWTREVCLYHPHSHTRNSLTRAHSHTYTHRARTPKACLQ